MISAALTVENLMENITRNPYRHRALANRDGGFGWLGIGRFANPFLADELIRRDHAAPIGFEVQAKSELKGLNFTLTGTADRIDRDDTGALAIYDYKTGIPPSGKVQESFDKQLLLEAAIAEQGGFKDIDAAPVTKSVFIGLSSFAKEVPAPLGDNPPDAVWKELHTLIAAYQSPTQGFSSRRMLFKDSDKGDYDQLARFGEWDRTTPPNIRGCNMIAPNEATERQIQAARPMSSTWLSANAGSGKTRVLTDRVARLLLNDVQPQHILCLTYTKAAAGEMQNRLFERLGSWAMLNDTDLTLALTELGDDGAIDPGRLAHARTLFARAIETPGGLKIQTIHSFCASLLRRFPLEAGVSPQFSEMEDRAADLLRAEIVEDFADGENAPLIDAIAKYATDSGLDDLTRAIVGKRDAFSESMGFSDLLNVFGLPSGFTSQDLEAQIFLGGEAELIRDLVTAMSTGSVTDIKNSKILAAITNPGMGDLAILEKCFLAGATSKTIEPFSAKLGSFPTKATQQANPDLMIKLEPFMLRVEAARAQRLGLMAARKSLALHQFANAFLPEYSRRKQIGGWLDFDDQILKARQLLNDPSVAAWVLYRLDGGIDHILVDEAQDTSPAQWDVIEKLAQEFTSGLGARTDVERTIFVVGDKKQSIYSFQGADPDAFDRMQVEFGDRLKNSGVTLEDLTLEYSFRSSDAILRLVDLVFENQAEAGFRKDSQHRAF